MDKINALTFITDTDPVPEAVLDASSWFETEYMTIEWSSLNSTSYIEWYMAQGWVKYDQTNWQENTGSAQSYTTVYYSKAFLKRRKLQSEIVLQDMITEFTDAYNEGREINDNRYDELVALYNTAVDKTEDEINALETDSDAYDDVIQGILDQMPTDLAQLESDLEGLLDDYGDSRRTAIETRFDSESTNAQQSLIDKGLNTTTLWGSVSAGVEREREQANTDFEDTLIERKVAIYLSLNDARVKLRLGLLEAHNRWIKLRQDNKLTPLDFRNRILTSMLTFMERRTDSYPGLEGLASMAAQLGYSEGSATVAP